MDLRDLETQLQTLVESRFPSLFAGQRPETLILQRLTAAMNAGTRFNLEGGTLAPNVYTVLVHPDSVNDWRDPALLETLVQILKAAARDRLLDFESSPTLTLAEDPDLSPGDFAVLASHRIETVEKTQEMQTESQGPKPIAEVSGAIPESAFLIVEGVKVFQLKQSVVNIGRRLDNSLVIDDPRVSRNHAQLRAIRGRYVLFDLSSSGGTYINGQRTTQSVLYPGDVISLAGVSLIFGQDSPVRQRDLAKTGPRSAVSAGRATAIIRNLPPGLKKNK
jgi:pSer/pThr/pTyr-binding forkhead associated (FHA) protein